MQHFLTADTRCQVGNDKTFTLKLKKPFPLALEALAKPSSNVPFIMPERIAKTDSSANITEPIGSGPFKFVKEEWVPGSKVVYASAPETKEAFEEIASFFDKHLGK